MTDTIERLRSFTFSCLKGYLNDVFIWKLDADIFGPQMNSSSKEFKKIKRSKKAILFEPRANIKRLEELTRRCGLNLINTRYDLLLNQLLLHTLTNIYVRLIPNYRIKKRGESTSGQVSAETQALWEYENRLLKNYGEYLRFIEKILDLFLDPEALEKFLADASLEQEYFHYFALRAASSAMHLLLENHHFNHRSRLIELNIKILCTARFSRQEKRQITKYHKRLVFNDVTAKSVCDMITGLCKKIVDMKFCVPAEAIRYFRYLHKHMFQKASSLIKMLPSKRAAGLPDQCRKIKFQMENPETLEEVRDKYKKKIDKQVENFYKTFWAFMHENDRHDDLLAWYQPLFSEMVVQIIQKLSRKRNDEVEFFWFNNLKTALENESIISKLRFIDMLTFLNAFNNWMSLAPDTYRDLVNFDIVSEHVYKFSNIIFNTRWTYEEWKLFFKCLEDYTDNVMQKSEYKKYAVKLFRNMVNNFLTAPHNFGLAEGFSLLSWIRKNQETFKEPWTNYYLIENDSDSGDRNNMTAAEESQRRRRAYSLINDMANRFPNGYFRYCMWVCFFKTSQEDFSNQMLAEEFGVDMSKLYLLSDYFKNPVEFYRFSVESGDYFA